jgi:hypothetical protein
MPKPIAVLLLFLVPACANTGDYVSDRGGDLADILRLHAVAGSAVAAEVQVTQFLGVGFAWEDEAWAGGLHNRAIGAWRESVHGWGLLIHDWFERTRGIPRYSGSYGWYREEGGPTFTGPDGWVDRFTVRATAALIVGLDVELRLGELIDFLVGIAGWDPAVDDGVTR